MFSTKDITLKVFHQVLSIVGISIYAEENWASKKWLLWQTLNFITSLLCFVFTTAFVAKNISNLPLLIEGACIWTTGVIMTITLGVCLIFRKDFRGFLSEMVFKDSMLEMPFVQQIVVGHQSTGKVGELKRLVASTQRKLLKYTRILLVTYVGAVYLCVILYLCNPMYHMLTREDESMRILGFEMLLPWSLESYYVYTISLIFNIYCAHLCCIAYPALQSTIILLVGQLIRQLRVLSFILEHMNELVQELIGNSDDRWETHCRVILSQCIVHYVKLKRFSNRLNVICRPFYLALILVAIMLVCVCSVKIATSANKLSLDTMKYILHEFCFIVVVLSFCLLGQQVENECDVLERVVIENWYIFDAGHRTNMRIFKLALSQRMPIYIFGTITLALPTFTWFIKTGMSFFTLVMSVLEQ